MSTNKDTDTNKNTAASGAKYTRLTVEDIDAVLERAEENAAPFICTVDFDERAGLVAVEGHEDIPGTFFVDYRAETWREAAAFQAAVIGAAWSKGHFAEAGSNWDENLTGGEDDGRRLVSVFVAAADYVDGTGESDECKRHLNKALAGIELAAHVARLGQEGYPPPYNRESPGAGRGNPSTAKRGSESGLQPPRHEAVAQGGTRSNTYQ